MRRGGEIRKARRGEREPGLVAQLRRPPGGRDARIMLLAQLLDRAGTGVWAAACVLYFTFVIGLDVGQVGLLLGASGVAGIAGSPLAGHLADRFPVRSLLIGAHLLRLVTLCLLLVVTDFTLLLCVVAVTHLGDRAAKTLEMLFATRVAGERRATYQALSRSSANAGYALGAGLAAIGLAVGTRGAHHVLILANALSFLVAAALVWCTREPRGRGLVAAPSPVPAAGAAAAPEPAGPAPAAVQAPAAGPDPAPAARRSPWRDRGYLRFVLLDIPMHLDDSILGIGIPLWLVSRTTAPHELIPAFLVINTVLVVVLQLRVSAKVRDARGATGAVALYGVTMLLCCGLLAAAAGGGVWAASGALLAAAVLATAAELMRSVSSWELAVSLAPREARASYLGVAGMAQSVQKTAGPLLLTGVVMAAGPAGWLALGAAVTGLSLVQRRFSLRRLEEPAVRSAAPASAAA
ncbi:MFS transporter [Streptomyces sp. NPDC090021]|uniref:MFS transporter n=1 Tax=Streptomyces sp. NPDC090021 TaxID=3365919 RepID=UPI003818D166